MWPICAMTGRPEVLIVAGPTASGKSALALALAQKLGGVIINADSMQVYRDLRILTARPSVADEACAEHRLYGVIDAAERFSAGRWRELAVLAIRDAHAAGQVAIVTGGTGFYLEALSHGLSPIPDIPPDVSASAAACCEAMGASAFCAKLAAIDPESARRIGPSDRQRLVRAWSVWQATGRSLSDWHREPPPPPPFRTSQVWLNPPRPVLYQRCDERLLHMLDHGALTEVETLLDRRLNPELPAMKALGMVELAAYLRGALPLDQAIAAAQQATRRFAKRQLTWFRNRLPNALQIDAQFSERIIDQIVSFIRKTG